MITNMERVSDGGPEAAADVAPRKICVVTGGSSGIGAAVCAEFAANGYEVVCVARRPCPLASAKSVLADLSSVDTAQASAEEVAQFLGEQAQVCLVHCASSYPSDAAQTPDVLGLHRALQLNVVAPSVLTARLLRHMAAGSSVIFVGSTLSEKAVAGKFSYCIAKHAMVGLMRATTQDLLRSGVHTVLVCPGITDTPMVREAIRGQETAFEGFASDLQGRMVTSQEVASIIADVARQPILNGTILHCNNGQRER